MTITSLSLENYLKHLPKQTDSASGRKNHDRHALWAVDVQNILATAHLFRRLLFNKKYIACKLFK